jgi:hypothetical protein
MEMFVANRFARWSLGRWSQPLRPDAVVAITLGGEIYGVSIWGELWSAVALRPIGNGNPLRQRLSGEKDSLIGVGSVQDGILATAYRCAIPMAPG